MHSQGFLTAELSCMISENGGYVLWIQDAFGDLAGFVSGYNSLISHVIDLPVYVVLSTDYLGIYLNYRGIGLGTTAV